MDNTSIIGAEFLRELEAETSAKRAFKELTTPTFSSFGCRFSTLESLDTPG